MSSTLPGRLDLTAYRGDDFNLDLVNNVATAWDSQGNPTAWTPVNMTGGSLQAQVRDSTLYTASVLVTFTINNFVPAAGSFTISLEPADTLSVNWTVGFYDIQYTTAGGEVQTLVFGDFTLNDDVSH